MRRRSVRRGKFCMGVLSAALVILMMTMMLLCFTPPAVAAAAVVVESPVPVRPAAEVRSAPDPISIPLPSTLSAIPILLLAAAVAARWRHRC